MLARSSNDELDRGPRTAGAETRRLCVVTGLVKPVEEMVRFVIAPDGKAVPDLKRRLPGRGIWITGTREALRSALARKAFARAFKREVRVSAELVETTERLIERAVLDALSMAHKAGKVAIGAGKTEVALAHEPVVALLHAADAAADGVRKLNAALHRAAAPAGIAVIDVLNSAQLDLALGRSNVIHAALLAGSESETFLARAARLARFRTGTGGTDTAVDRYTATRTGI